MLLCWISDRKRRRFAVPAQKARHRRFVEDGIEVSGVDLVLCALAVAKPAWMKDRLPSFAMVPIANVAQAQAGEMIDTKTRMHRINLQRYRGISIACLNFRRKRFLVNTVIEMDNVNDG